MLETGLYEQVINDEIKKALDVATDKFVQTARIDSAEASQVLASYVAEIIVKRLDHVEDRHDGLEAKVDLANKIIDLIQRETDLANLTVDQGAEQLLALFAKENSVYALADEKHVMRPETSIARSSLFTGAVHEPSMFTELKKEIGSSDRIDMLVSFIKWSGLRLIIDDLQAFAQKGGELRVITTSYMGATDIKAVQELSRLPGVKIKVSYDTKRTRLHAKTYVFYRNTGFTTAYVGSSNLSNAAMSSGLEWNVKMTAKELPDTIQKIHATFDSYWHSDDFEDYVEGQSERLARALKAEKNVRGDGINPYFFDIMPYPYQEEILDKLKTEREVRGRARNLVVAATGTGKTVISAFDYKRFLSKHPNEPCRLLFVAHREEILRQSISTFRGVLKDENFGDLFVGGFRKPDSIDHLFMSIQTFNSQSWADKTTPSFYDYIVVDEFHHAAAPTYQKLLEHYDPKILLGLTATPERMDGKSVTSYFGNKIAAKIRLPEAIDRKLLCPFQYFGVSDSVDLSTLKWTRGGYDKTELSNVYSLHTHVAEHRSDLIIRSLSKYVTDLDDVKGLGFCVSVAHAKFMSDRFNEKGIPSMYLTGDSQDEVRYKAKQKLVSGEVTFIFVVDIYNEGVDIPEVNTVLFLRPTESLTVFLQQLGRGLRLAENKECLTVLDFIGQANKKYAFEDKFAALLDNTTRSVQREIKDGFISVPKGCYIQLEKKAKDYILDNVRSSFDSKAGIISRLASFTEDTEKELTLASYLEHYRLDPRKLYKRASFARLLVLAGVKDDFNEPLETVLTKAFPRICALDSRRWITFLLHVLDNIEVIVPDTLSSMEQAMLRMFYNTVWQNDTWDMSSHAVRANLLELSKSPVMLAELKDLLAYNLNCIDFVDEPVSLGFDCPLDLHCNYSRDQLLLALGINNPKTIREGVKWIPDKQCDVFMITLNKADKEYSPTTMYNDYSINRWLFHWQSQSTTSADSPTGQRYIHHKARGSKVLLFVREFKNDIVGAAPYTFLGLADYAQHEGSRPMNITYRLQRPIPAKYLKKTNKLVVG